MSTDNHSLDDFRTGAEIREHDPEDEESEPLWADYSDEEPKDTGARHICEQCGESVSSDFSRVFGDNDGRLRSGCKHCSSFREYATSFDAKTHLPGVDYDV